MIAFLRLVLCTLALASVAVAQTAPYPPAWPKLPAGQLAQIKQDFETKNAGWTIELDDHGFSAAAVRAASSVEEDFYGDGEAEITSFLQRNAHVFGLPPQDQLKFVHGNGLDFERGEPNEPRYPALFGFDRRVNLDRAMMRMLPYGIEAPIRVETVGSSPPQVRITGHLWPFGALPAPAHPPEDVLAPVRGTPFTESTQGGYAVALEIPGVSPGGAVHQPGHVTSGTLDGGDLTADRRLEFTGTAQAIELRLVDRAIGRGRVVYAVDAITRQVLVPLKLPLVFGN